MALATFDRDELHKHVITSSQFKLFLELDPQLREIIFSFYESKYGKCLKLLEDIKDNLMLDLYLSCHVNRLYSMIRNRGLVQYFSPYLSADLRLMASCFNTSLASLEDELMTLILDGQIQARIDSHNKVEKVTQGPKNYLYSKTLFVFRSFMPRMWISGAQLLRKPWRWVAFTREGPSCWC